MAISNTSPFWGAASAEALRQVYATQLRGQGDAVAASIQSQFAQTQVGAPPPGSTITAKYQYQVGPDGGLIPLETTITTESGAVESATDKQRGSNKRTADKGQQNEQNQPSLADVSPTRAQLSPAAEAALFAVSVAPAARQPQQAALSNTSIVASDEDGTPVEAELLTPGQQPANDNGSTTLADRARAAVNNLYARNNDIIYNVNPVAVLAA